MLVMQKEFSKHIIIYKLFNQCVHSLRFETVQELGEHTAHSAHGQVSFTDLCATAYLSGEMKGGHPSCLLCLPYQFPPLHLLENEEYAFLVDGKVYVT